MACAFEKKKKKIDPVRPTVTSCITREKIVVIQNAVFQAPLHLYPSTQRPLYQFDQETSFFTRMIGSVSSEVSLNRNFCYGSFLIRHTSVDGDIKSLGFIWWINMHQIDTQPEAIFSE